MGTTPDDEDGSNPGAVKAAPATASPDYPRTRRDRTAGQINSSRTLAVPASHAGNSVLNASAMQSSGTALATSGLQLRGAISSRVFSSVTDGNSSSANGTGWGRGRAPSSKRKAETKERTARIEAELKSKQLGEPTIRDMSTAAAVHRALAAIDQLMRPFKG